MYKQQKLRTRMPAMAADNMQGPRCAFWQEILSSTVLRSTRTQPLELSSGALQSTLTAELT